MYEENTNTMNQEVVNVESTDENSVDLVNLDEVPYYDDEPSGAGIIAGFATAIVGAVGIVAGGVKLSQKIYEKRCNKAEKPVECREKFYQVWRPKAPKSAKKNSREYSYEAESVDADCEAVNSDD